MPDWKRVNIDFPTVKLGQFIEPIKESYKDKGSKDFDTVYGVTNISGITITGKKPSDNTSKYIILDKDYFVYNPYRINVGSIGYNSTGVKGCVSPAYVVFKTKRELNPSFLYHYLKSEFGNHLINWYGNHGGVRNSLKYRDLCQIDIPDVNYSKQTQIVERIDNLKLSASNFDRQFAMQSDYTNNLRQQVLQEAIEGKLTAKWREQHPELISGDDQASKLLEKIKSEKEQLIKEGKIRKEKPLATISDEEPFELPEGWVWCRLADVCSKIGSGSTPRGSNYSEKGIPFFRSQNIHNEGIVYQDIKSISSDVHNQMKGTAVLAGDLLLNITGGSLGRCALVPSQFTEGNVSQHVCIIRVITISSEFIHKLILSPQFQKRIFQYTTGAGREGLPKYNLEQFIIPLPPLAEQKAIVNRVDTLMRVISELGEKVLERKEQSEMLTQSVLREAFALS